jgi:hypothetical protein
MKRLLLTVATFAVLASPAAAGYIGIFTDQGASSCVAEVGATPYIDLHVVAVLEDNTTIMTGAQFQITGIPAGWTPQNALWVPDAGVTVNIGHPLFANTVHPQTPGVNLAFSRCLAFPEDDTIPLGRIILLGAPTPENVTLRVQGYKLVPTDPDCVIVTHCAPYYEIGCIAGGEIVLNGNKSTGCQVAVAEETWTKVKRLYRD